MPVFSPFLIIFADTEHRVKLYLKKERCINILRYEWGMFPNMPPITLVRLLRIFSKLYIHSNIERHLEKTPIQYIQWRFQDGHDRE